MPVIFYPTLLPDPFGETSPELCWQLFLTPMTTQISVRLTQFGWSLILSTTDHYKISLQAEDLPELRSLLLQDTQLPVPLFSALNAPWVLAYEIASD